MNARELITRRRALEKKQRTLEAEESEYRSREASLSPRDQRALSHTVAERLKCAADLDALREEEREVMRAGIPDGFSVTRGDNPGDGPYFTRHVDPWVVPSFNDSPQEVRDRGLAAVEQVEARDNGLAEEDRARVESLIREDEGTDVARYTIATTNPAYETAFARWAKGNSQLWTDEERAAVREVDETVIRQESRTALTTTGTGGLMLPFFIDPAIILSNASAVNPFRQISRVETIPTNIWHGVSSAGSTAEWTSELAETTESSPVLAQPSITPVRGDVNIQASLEQISDSNIVSQLGMLFADAKNRLETTAFATGSGSTQPKGIVTALQAVTASRVNAQTSGQFSAVDCFAMVNSLSARWQDNASWMGHWFMENLIRQFTSSASPQAGNYWVDLGGATPPRLLGAPWYRCSAILNAGGTAGLSAATSSNDDVLLLADFRQFVIIDRMGTEVVTAPLYGPNLRLTGGTQFVAFWRTGSDLVVTDAGRLLRI